MNDHPKPTFLKYGGIFVFGVGVVGIGAAIVNRAANWNTLRSLISGLAFLYIGSDMYWRSKMAR